MIQLVVERGENVGRTWPLVEAPTVTTIGRGADNAIVLSDAKVSRLHCQIEPQGQSLVLVDKSANGVLVNNRKVPGQIALQPGMRIQVGDTVLRVEQTEGASQPADDGRTLVEAPASAASPPVTPGAPAAAVRLGRANLVAIAAGLAAGLIMVGVVTTLALAAGRTAPTTAGLPIGIISSQASAEPAPLEPTIPLTVTATAPSTPTITALITPTVEPSLTPPAAATGVGPVITGTVLAAAGLNVRADPRVNAEVLYQVKQGEQVLILGRSDLNDWLLIQCRPDQAAEAACWLANYLVAISGSLTDVPVMSP
jgi:pSer/pThr/pTyr-binding forkhead associated (FHA) protein